MSTLIKQSLSYCGLILLAAATIIVGYKFSTAKSTPDPLAGWTFREFDDYVVPSEQRHYQLDKAIADDYQTFIQQNKLNLFGAITGFYDSGNGQHAIRCTAFSPNKNATWNYILFYDKDNKRTKVVKYGYTRYQS